jgi:hypothetical protein
VQFLTVATDRPPPFNPSRKRKRRPSLPSPSPVKTVVSVSTLSCPTSPLLCSSSSSSGFRRQTPPITSRHKRRKSEGKEPSGFASFLAQTDARVRHSPHRRSATRSPQGRISLGVIPLPHRVNPSAVSQRPTKRVKRTAISKSTYQRYEPYRRSTPTKTKSLITVPHTKATNTQHSNPQSPVRTPLSAAPRYGQYVLQTAEPAAGRGSPVDLLKLRSACSLTKRR